MEAKVERLTREGKENAGASYDPTGKRLVMVTNRGQGAGLPDWCILSREW